MIILNENVRSGVHMFVDELSIYKAIHFVCNLTTKEFAQIDIYK